MNYLFQAKRKLASKLKIIKYIENSLLKIFLIVF